MKGYEKYIEDVTAGNITTCKYIQQVVRRFCAFRERDDVYFDNDAVDRCIAFVGCMRHYLGKSAGQNFILLPWQQFFLACIIGLKWEKDGTRVCREVYLQMARKQGKSALIAALALYFLIVDGENAPEIACLATSREQAHLIFDMITNFGKSLDASGKTLKYYRNSIKLNRNNGQVKVYSSESGRLDGLNISLGILDEAAALRDISLYSVIKSSMGMRTQPLIVQITTPQFSLQSPAYKTYQTSIEILGGIKEDDTFWPFLYTLDLDDKWDDESNWQKSNPSLGTTVTLEFLRNEVNAAKNDSTREMGVKVKNIGIWTQSSTVWIPQSNIVQCMQKVVIEDYIGMNCVCGVDLSAVNDLTSVAVMIPLNADDASKKYIFKVWCWIPQETFEKSANKVLYEQFVQEGSLCVTPGNVVDYDAITNKLNELRNILNVDTIYYDAWNSTQWAINATSMGYNLQPFSQAIGNYSTATKEITRLILSGGCVLDASTNLLWQFSNVVLKIDHNGNQKPSKAEYQNKIDSIIAMTTALGGSLKNTQPTDFKIYSF